jgi:hypothetical protein
MRRTAAVPTALLAGFLALTAARADDLTGADRFLCSASDVTACEGAGDCEIGSAADLNIPQFIEVDLAGKRLSTTKASGLNRSSAVDSVRRAAGTIVLQGFENGRAFSFVIVEKTGAVTVAVASATRGVTAFGSCTPVPASR